MTMSLPSWACCSSGAGSATRPWRSSSPVQRAAEEVALHQAALTREAVEPVALRVHVVVPAARGDQTDDAAVEPAGADDAVREMLAQPCGQRDAVLVIQPLLELAEEHTFPLTAPRIGA